MKKLTPSFLTVAICLSLHSFNSVASVNQCLVDVPTFDRPLVDGDINTLPVQISSEKIQAELPNQTTFSGDVSVTQGNRSVNSDTIILTQEQNRNRNLVLKGNVVYLDNFIKMRGDNASMNLDTHDIQIENSQYHLVGRLGRGSAENMQFNKNRYIVLKDGSFTSCPVDDSSWNIEGSEIIHDNDEQLLKVRNAVFRIGNVPVLYTPYLQLPTGNKRRSGLLMPDFNYNTIDGVNFSLPIYWNIAPNYDATFTPRIIQRRGFQLQNEFRYLNEIGLGTLAFDWMQHDSLYSDDKKNLNSDDYSNNNYRWLFHWKNEELINYNWRFSVNATRVSDHQYITDLGSKYASETDGYLTQNYKVGYTDENWDIALNYRYFQALWDDTGNELYRTEPQLNINYYNYDFDDFSFRTFSQVSHFVSSGHNKPQAWRFHVEPTLEYTLLSSWASIKTETGFMATRYYQDIPSSYTQTNLKKNVNRFMPKFNIDGKVIFERDVDSFEGYTQTLEPRIKYVYIPYRNQSETLNYDSSLLQSDYIGLFRDHPYSGLDRIASSNKIASGLTTRFYDENKIEKFNLSLGQIYYFNHSRTGDNYSPLDLNKETGSLTWATDTFWRVNDDLIFRSGMQYDTRINEISLANAILEYRTSERKMIQVSYRYANENYIDSIGINSSTNKKIPYQQDLSQFGTMTSWPLSENVSVVGSIFYDISNKQISDSFVGLHYADCCWGVSLQFGRKITGWDNKAESSEYKNKFSINFELRGLTKNSNAVAKMLNFGLLPYKTAFDENYGTN